MPAARVIEAIDVFEDSNFSDSAGLPGVPPDQLCLEGFEEGFHGGIEAPIFVNMAFLVFLACIDG